MLVREDSYGVIVLDSREREKDDRLRRFFERLRIEGTGFMELDRLVDSLLLGPSHFSVGLQVADLVVGSTVAGRRGQLNDASRWHKLLLERCFARHPDTGAVDGVGLKDFPPRPKGEEHESKLFRTRCPGATDRPLARRAGSPRRCPRQADERSADSNPQFGGGGRAATHLGQAPISHSGASRTAGCADVLGISRG